VQASGSVCRECAATLPTLGSRIALPCSTSIGKEFAVARELTVFLIVPSKPRRFGLRDGDRFLQLELGRFLGGVHISRKVQVVEDEYGLNGVGSGDAGIFNHDEVIAISFFSASGEVGGTRENLSGGEVEIGDDELVVLVDTGARAELCGECGSDALLEIVPTNQADSAVWFLNAETFRFVGNAVAENGLVGKAVYGCADCVSSFDLSQEGDSKED